MPTRGRRKKKDYLFKLSTSALELIDHLMPARTDDLDSIGAKVLYCTMKADFHNTLGLIEIMDVYSTYV